VLISYTKVQSKSKNENCFLKSLEEKRLTRIIHAFPITKPNYLLYIAMLKNYFMQKGETIIA